MFSQHLTLHHCHHINILLKDTRLVMNQSMIDTVVQVISDIRHDFGHSLNS